MGLMRFLVAPPHRITAEAAGLAYLVGSEQIPWVSRVQLQDGFLSLGGTSPIRPARAFPSRSRAAARLP